MMFSSVNFESLAEFERYTFFRVFWVHSAVFVTSSEIIVVVFPHIMKVKETTYLEVLTLRPTVAAPPCMVGIATSQFGSCLR